MSLKSKLGLLCGALFLLAPAGALQAQTPPPTAEFYPGTPRITLYSQQNFNGQRVDLSDDAADLRRQNFNDRTWSIRVEAGDWEVCEDINYGGRCIRVNNDVANFTPANWVSSVRLVRNGSGPGGGGGGGFVDRPQSGIRLFDGPNYTGQRFDTQSEIYDLNRTGFNDRASSIAIARGESWEVCMDSNFRSQCQVFSDNVRDLAQYGYFNNSISSVRRVGGGGWPGGPGGPGGPGRPGGPGGNWYTDIDGGIEGIGTMFFPVPEINGRSIDRCMASGGRDCDTATADAICREAGYSEAAYFSVDRGRRYRTIHLGNGQECRTGRCEAMLNVLCISER